MGLPAADTATLVASLVPRLPRLERASASGTLCREPRPFDAARPGPGPGPGPAGGAPVTLVLRSLVPTRDLRRRVAALGREGWRHRREEGPADLTLALDSLRGSPLRGRVTGLDLSHQTLTDGRVWVHRPGGDGAVDPFGGGLDRKSVV